MRSLFSTATSRFIPRAKSATGVAVLMFAAAGACLVGLARPAAADIIWSGPVNIVIPDNLDGVYMNVVTGVTGSSEASAPGWDINPYSALSPNTHFNLWGPTTQTFFNPDGVISGNYNLPQGTVIGPAGTYFRPGGGTNLAPQMNLNSDQNLIGFRFVNEANANQIHFGWARIEFGATIGTRSIVEYAYQDVAGVAIGAGVIPEPATLGLFALAGVALLRRR